MSNIIKFDNCEKFHGHKVIADNDLINAMGHEILELTSNNDLVLRSYDLEGNEGPSYKVDEFSTMPNVITGIRQQAGNRSFLISATARDYLSVLEESY